MRLKVVSACLVLSISIGAAPAMFAAGITDAELDRRFTRTVRPFVDQYCKACHSGTAAAAQLDLTTFRDTASVKQDLPHWTLLLERLSAQEMPPKGATQPPAARRQEVMDWVNAVRANELAKSANDPGVVLARRLSNSEYNYTIRDLTGVDLKPTREFPADPANQSGFDNSGESLNMSPSLLNKYLQAAREVADHMVLRPDGIFFASHPMLVETDREKYAVDRILSFYASQPTDFADYFEASWRFKHRAALGRPAATLASVAAEMKLSPRYLPMVWQYLETKEEVGPGAKLHAMWRTLPAPKAGQSNIAREGCVQMRDFVGKIRKHTAKLSFPPTPPGMRGGGGGGGIVFAMWKNQMVAASHRDFDPTALRVQGEPPPTDLVVTRGPTFGQSEVAELKIAQAAYIKERQEDPDLVVPTAADRPRYEEALRRFSNVFPDKFYLRERGRFYPVDVETDKGRYLSAGVHNMMGYYRDDTALIELILDDKAKKEIDILWQDFEYISDYTRPDVCSILERRRCPAGPQRGVPGAGFTDLATEGAIRTSRDAALQRLGAAANPEIAKAILDHYDGTNAAIRWAERARRESEPVHLDALLKFARRAYRRPLEPVEREEILAYYKELREKNGLSHEDAIRASIVSLLVSPDFCYRVDLHESGTQSSARPAGKSAIKLASADGPPTRPLSAHALASRLSYFLWSSMPDEELLARAAAGDLTKPDVLPRRSRRMLQDDASAGPGHRVRRQLARLPPVRGTQRRRPRALPEFHERTARSHVRGAGPFRADICSAAIGSVLDLLYGELHVRQPGSGQALRDAGSHAAERTRGCAWTTRRQYGRGGLLPMSVFLTRTRPGLRTSPVKRGYWVVRRLLGERSRRRRRTSPSCRTTKPSSAT